MTRRVALVLAAVSLGALAGCDGVVGARMTFDDTETTKVTDIVLNGGSGDLIVTSDATTTETKIRRIVRGGTGPGESYKLAGGVLTLDTDCGRDCSVSYEVTAPAGVTVRGSLSSGDIALTGVGPVDLQLTSGDVMVEQSTGPVKLKGTSGDLRVVGGSEVSLETRSGDLDVLESKGPVTARVTSGDISVDLIAAASVTASANSGDVDLMVPAGAYRVVTQTGTGDEETTGITNDPKAAAVLDLKVHSGDLSVIAR